MARTETWFDQDLKKPVSVRIMAGVQFSEDNQGSLIGVRVYDDGADATLTGGVTGYCILADGQTITVDGTREGNTAYILLPQSALLVPGPIQITIKLVDDGVITTLLACVGTVIRTKIGVPVVPESVIEEWSEQISETLQECVDDCQAAADAMGANLATTYSTSATYPVGAYVIQSGTLYRCTTAVTTAGSWSTNSSKFTAVKLGNDVADLKSALKPEPWTMGNVLADNTDFDNLTTPGLYRGSATATYVNIPSQIVGIEFILEVIGTNNAGGGFIVQRIATFGSASNDYFFTRVKSGAPSTWKSWDKVYSQLEQSWTFNNLANGTDFNTLTVPGIYRGSTTTAYVNCPDAVLGHEFVLEVFGGNSIGTAFTIQRIITYGTSAGNTIYTRSRPNSTSSWKTWEIIYSQSIIGVYNTIADSTDFDTLVVPGIYKGTATTTYTNCPANILGHTFILEVFSGVYGGSSTTVIIQRIITYGNSGNTIYTRIRTGSPSTWQSWDMIYNQSIFGASTSIAGATDFDTLIMPGIYRGTGDNTYVHCPEDALGRRFIMEVFSDVYGESSTTVIVQRIITYGSSGNAIFERERVGAPSTWTSWYTVYSQEKQEFAYRMTERNDIMSYTNDVYTANAENKGLEIKILTYNVAHYNHDSTTMIPDKYRFNFKKMLSDIRPDIIATQEDQNYIDAGEIITASAGIYNPVYPYKSGTFATNIYSKRMPLSAYTMVTTSSARTVRAALYKLDNNKNLLIVSVHSAVRADPSDTSIDPFGPESISKRLEEYAEYFKWVYKESTMNDFTSGNPVEAPSWDYCVIAGDFNCITQDDQANVKSLAAARNFSCANGGWLGWLETARNAAGTTRTAIDNILCSSSIIIDSITSHKELYHDLYSDHYPFEATLTLF